MQTAALLERPISEPGFHAAPHGRVSRRLRIERPDYAAAPVDSAFDWADCLMGSASGTFFLVVFRSVRRVGADAELLTEFDDLAHAEARQSGGLHFSSRACRTPTGPASRLCLWDSPEEAHAALGMPRHQAAVRLAREMYQSFRLERYAVTWDRAWQWVEFRTL